MSEAAFCPACARPVDPLRAGEVAIIGGKFLYFCERSCKVDHLESLRSSVLSEDFQTAEPPPVAQRVLIAPTEGEPAPRIDDTFDLPARASEAEDSPVDEVDSFEHEAAPPSQLDSESVVDTPSGRLPLIRIATAGALAAGLLSLGSPLLGGSVLALRGPLALGAVALAIARESVTLRERTKAGWLTAAALLGSAVAVLGSQARHGSQTTSITVLAALAATASVLIRELIEREQRPLRESRAILAAQLLAPANVVDSEGSRERYGADVRPGDLVRIAAGDSAPVDGVVASGEAIIVPWPEAPIESVIRAGDAVLAGATVLTGLVNVTATRCGADRALSRLAVSTSAGVDVAAAWPLLSRQIATRGAPTAALIAGAATLALASRASWLLGFSYAIAVASAAALALCAEATAAFISLSHARASLRAQQRSGIIYKHAAAFDLAGRAEIAVACARGTLLLGEPEIVAIDGYAGWDTARILSVAAALASGSTHPFSLTIAQAARSRGVKPTSVGNIIHDGSGITGLDETGERVVLGRRSFLLSERVGVAAADVRVSDLEAQGRSALLLAAGGKIVGLVALHDGLRVGARSAVQRLHEANIEPVMLCGESRETSDSLARSLDIEHVRPEVLAADRGDEVRALSEGGSVVAVIGHASTDNAALAAADVSIALASAGGASAEWSVALATDDVRDAVLALTIARDTREVARRALVLGLLPGVACALVLALGWAPLWLGPLAGIIGAVAAALCTRD